MGLYCLMLKLKIVYFTDINLWSFCYFNILADGGLKEIKLRAFIEML